MDDRIDDLIRDEARDYNDPPATPRDRMWERIEMARNAGRIEGRKDDRLVVLPERASRRGTLPLFRLGIGIAALLALGIGIGRTMERADSHRMPVVAAAPATSTTQRERCSVSLRHRVRFELCAASRASTSSSIH